MKKLFLMMVASMLMTGAFADTLYWLVDQEPDDAIKFDYAALRVAKGETKVEDVYLCTLAAAGGLKTDLGVAELGDYGSGYSFYVELYDNAAKSVGITGLYAYGDLLEAGYIASSGIGTGGDQTWTVTSEMISVPEPTSALLLLMGLAPLALKRKKEK